MGFRFRQSIKIAHGLRLNLGLKAISVSFGTRGLTYTLGTSAERVTAGIPGTGLSYTTKLWSGSASKAYPRGIVMVAIAAALFGAAALILSLLP
jgi:hypothetical protein